MNAGSLEVEIVSEEEIKKLERVKILLTEIKSLRDELFGKQNSN